MIVSGCDLLLRFTHFPGTRNSFPYRPLFKIKIRLEKQQETFLRNLPSLVGLAFLIQSVRWRTKSKKKSPSGTLITCTGNSYLEKTFKWTVARGVFRHFNLSEIIN
jgi:hypothetical protein